MFRIYVAFESDDVQRKFTTPIQRPRDSALTFGSLAVLCAFLTWRLLMIGTVATHVDDLVPLAEHMRQHGGHGTFSQIIELSRFYTYPPGQFLISLPLTRLAATPEDMLFWFRLPSFLFWMAGLLGGYWLLRSLLGGTNERLATLAILPVLFSWRGIIESSQGYNYAAALPACVLIAALCLTERGQRLHRHPAGAIVTGLLMGICCWFTYQAIFIAAASLAYLGLRSIQRRSLRELLATLVAAVAFAGPVWLVYHICLRYVLAFASGTPRWAGGVPGSTLGQKLTFPFRAWFEVVQNNFTFLPWGWPTVVLTSVVLAVIAIGLICLICRREKSGSLLPVLGWVACVMVVFLVGPYLGKFPLGATRHSFVLQWPLVLLWAAALSALPLSVSTYRSIIVLASIVFVAALPQLVERIRGRVDLRLIEHYLRRHPESRIVDSPGGFTWDFMLIAANDPERWLPRMRWHNQFSDIDEAAKFLAGTETSFMVSHRGPLGPETKDALRRAGFRQILSLSEIKPTGSNELSGNINGGNGFYFYELRR